jgi:hypothetical protein
MTLVWGTELPAGDKLVLLALADCANDEGHCWPGVRSLCAKTGKCERSLQASIKALCDGGHLTRDEVKGKGCNYLVHPRKICTPAETTPPQNMRKPPQKLRDTPAEIAGKPSKNHQEPSPIKCAHELSDDWKPIEFSSESESRKVVDGWPPGEFAVQLEMFRAQHGKKGDKFRDWQKAWSTWVLNTRRFGIGRNYERPDTNPTGTALARVQTALRSGGAFN